MKSIAGGVVLDASVVIELLLGTTRGKQIIDRIVDPNLSLHAPELLDLEVTQVLRRYVLQGLLPDAEAERVLERLAKSGIHRYEHLPLLPRVWHLRHQIKAYDAAYVALALTLGTPLWTADRRLAKASVRSLVVETF